EVAVPADPPVSLPAELVVVPAVVPVVSKGIGPSPQAARATAQPSARGTSASDERLGEAIRSGYNVLEVKPMGPRFSAALAFANEIHGSQVRKASNVPYIAHLLSVAALVIEHGGDEDAAVAALLHDAVEDQGGQAMLVRIRERFGERVADIVMACSDTD